MLDLSARVRGLQRSLDRCLTEDELSERSRVRWGTLISTATQGVEHAFSERICLALQSERAASSAANDSPATKRNPQRD